jgi:hypothetical protein
MLERPSTATGSGFTVGKPAADARRPSHSPLRVEIAHAYEAAYGQTCRVDTLDALESIVAWLRRCEHQDGRTFLRSVPQAARGIGWPSAGGAKSDHNRHRNSLVRRLEMLREMGIVESYEPLWKANREGRGILVALRRDSSVGRASLSRAARSRRRDCSSPTVSPPLREKSPCTTSRDRGSWKNRQARVARARGAGLAGHRATARAIEALSAAGEGSGAELIDRLPWLCSLAPAVLLRAATYVFAPRPESGWAKHWTPRLSERSRLRAERAVAELDRLDGRGAGAAAILELAKGGWRLHTPRGRQPRFVEPRTPGLLVKGLRQRARLAGQAAEWRAAC